MRPTDLDDLTPLEPDEHVLTGVRTRGASFRRRRRYQRSVGVASGVVVIALALALGIATARVGTSKNQVSTPVPTATTTTTTTTIAPRAPTPITATPYALVGSWRPVSVAGYSGPLTSPPLIEPPVLRFGDYGTWSGSDGCNDTTSGTFKLGARGAIELGGGMTTQVGCKLSVPFPSATTRIDVADDRLELFGEHGQLVALYERESIRARLELPSTTVTGGSNLTGRVLVTNDTGRPVSVTGCLRYFAVLLTSADSAQAPGWLACAQGFTFPVGESSFPVTIIASYTGCEPRGPLPPCLANNVSPPLPPGEYQARLLQRGEAVSIAAPITVRVLSSP